MARYPFVDPDGLEFEVTCDMCDAERLLPPIDGKFYRLNHFEGRTGKRLVPALQRATVSKPRHFEARTLPPNYKYHKLAGGEFDPKTGRPRFGSWQDIERTVAVANAHGESLVYDGEREIGTPEKTVDDPGGLIGKPSDHM